MKKILIFTLALTLLLGVSGCSQEEHSVSTDGSTSMEKVINILGESFTDKYEDVKFTYNPTGSGSGITAVKEGRCDIGLASRALKEEEKAQGLEETVLAYDGIAIIVNPQNPVENLTLAEIAALYTGKIINWQEVGGADLPVVLIGREAGSGTREGFETITKTKDSCKYRQELTSTGDVITAVSQNPNAIGYASLSAVKTNVKALKVNGIAPSETTVKNGSYQVQRPFMLISVKDRPLNKTAQAFFDYITSPAVKELIASAGVVAAD